MPELLALLGAELMYRSIVRDLCAMTGQSV
jgi:hypothetical protein